MIEREWDEEEEMVDRKPRARVYDIYFSFWQTAFDVLNDTVKALCFCRLICDTKRPTTDDGDGDGVGIYVHCGGIRLNATAVPMYVCMYTLPWFRL